MNTTLKIKTKLAEAQTKVDIAGKAFDAAWKRFEDAPTLENRALVKVAHAEAMAAFKVLQAIERSQTSHQFKKAGF